MKLAKAIRLMSEDYQDYKEFLGVGDPLVAEHYKDRVSNLMAYINFRMDYGCPDVEAYEIKAAKAIRKYAKEVAEKAVERLIPVDAGPF